MRYLIALEQTEKGFSVQVPDLAIITHGENVEKAKQEAIKAIKINLQAYKEAGKKIPKEESLLTHLENPDFKDVLFSYVKVTHSKDKVAA